jgi:hypothetical protein
LITHDGFGRGATGKTIDGDASSTDRQRPGLSDGVALTAGKRIAADGREADRAAGNIARIGDRKLAVAAGAGGADDQGAASLRIVAGDGPGVVDLKRGPGIGNGVTVADIDVIVQKNTARGKHHI